MGKNKYSEQDEHDLDWMFTFGKWKYSTIKSVLQKDPQYIEWCLENMDGFAIDEEVEELLESEELRLATFGD